MPAETMSLLARALASHSTGSVTSEKRTVTENSTMPILIKPRTLVKVPSRMKM